MKRKHLLLILLLAIGVPLAAWAQAGIYSENFDNYTVGTSLVLPTGWTSEQVGNAGATASVMRNVSGNVHASSVPNYFVMGNAQALTRNAGVKVTLPSFTMPVNCTRMTFKVKSSRADMGSNTLIVGVTYTSFPNGTQSTSVFTCPASTTYQEKTVFFNMPTVPSDASIYFAYAGKTGAPAGTYWYIDDVVVENDLRVPTNLEVSNLTKTSATLSCSLEGNGDVQYGYATQSDFSETQLATSSSLSNLEGGVTYYVKARSRVRKNASSSWHYSDWSDPISFTTPCYDFSAAAPSGQTLYFNIIDTENHLVELTHPAESTSNPWSGYEKPTGSITLPETVTYNSVVYTVTAIGANAFRSCSGLTGDLTIPNSVTSLGSHAFYGCTGFNGVLTLSEQLTEIPQSVFSSCQNITGDLVIPNSVTTIGNSAFSDLRNISSLTLGMNVGTVGTLAFNHCIGLNQITLLPDTPPTVQSTTFVDIPTSISVYVPQGSLSAYQNANVWRTFNLVELRPHDFSSEAPTGQTLYYTITDATNQYVAVTHPNPNVATPWEGFDMPTGVLTIPSTVNHEGINYTVTAIDRFAFKDCSGVTGTWSVPATVTTIGTHAYDGCSSFTGDLVIPEQLASIGDYAFKGCTGFDKSLIIIPGNTLTLGNACFYGCSNLLEVIPLSLTPPVATSQSFSNYAAPESGSKPRVYFPNSEYQSAYFAAGTGWLPLQNQEGLENYAMYDLAMTKNGVTLYYYIKSQSTYGYTLVLTNPGTPKHPYLEDIAGLMGVDAPEKPVGEILVNTRFDENQIRYTVVEIEAGAFWNSTGLTKVVVGNSPSGVIINENAFSGCTALTTLSIGRSDINENAFAGCTALTILTLNNAIIKENAFAGCTNLTTINATSTTFLVRAFADFTSLTTLNVNYGTIGERAFAGCTGLAMPHFNNGTMLGTSASIGEWAFDGCTFNIEDGSTVTLDGGTIAANAFGGCTINGASLHLDCRNVRTIGESAFENCNFGGVTIGDFVQTIGASAFKGCSQLSELTLGEALTAIGESAFENCAQLATPLEFGDALTTIGASAFKGCSQIPSLDLGNATTTIGPSAFEGCSGFTGRLAIPTTVEEIGSKAFKNCIGFDKVLSVSTTPANAADDSFEGLYGKQLVVVPEAVSAYQSANGWRLFTNRIKAHDLPYPESNQGYWNWSGFEEDWETSVTPSGSGTISIKSHAQGVLVPYSDLQMTVSSSASPTVFNPVRLTAIFPYFIDFVQLATVSFQLKASSTNSGTFRVGYVDDDGAFHYLVSYSALSYSDDYVPVTVNLSQFDPIPKNSRLAFQSVASSTTSKGTSWSVRSPFGSPIVSILAPSNLSVDPNTATIRWESGGFGTFEVNYKNKVGDITSVNSIKTDGSSTTSYTIPDHGGINVGRLYYDFKVRGKVVDNEGNAYYSDWTETSDWFLYGVEAVETLSDYFDPNCGEYDEVSNSWHFNILPQYWFAMGDGEYPTVSTSENRLSFSTNGDDQYVILRPISNMNGKSVIFNAMRTESSATIQVGYFTNPTDPSTFVGVATYTLGNYYQLYETVFSNYTSSEDCYVAIKLRGNESETTGVYLQDIVVTTIDKRYVSSETSNMSNEWNEAGKWQLEGVPTLDDNVLVPVSVRIDDGHVAQANDIILGPSATIHVHPGAQLLHANPKVNAYAYYSVLAYGDATDNSNFNFIASPMAGEIEPTSIIPLNEGQFEYDLYCFDEGREAEWLNYKKSVFNLANGKGYLYGISTLPSSYNLFVAGHLQPSNEPFEVPLQYTEGASLAGWNLIGNPFACAAIVDYADYYVLDADNHNAVVPSSGIVPSRKGIFVKATGEGQSATFSRGGMETNNGNGILNVEVAQKVTERGGVSKALVDKARVRFGEGDGLEKFQLNPNHTKIYIPMAGKDYAVTYAESRVGELPLNFEAEANGTYTLSFSNENVEFSHLHLIDNLTGVETNLLATPSYTFEARTTDYASRFRVVFAAAGAGGDTCKPGFAFNHNGNWIILNEGRATLQVIDMSGRVLSSEQIEDSVQTSIHQPAGLYLIRLVNGDDVKVQKIVVQ